MKKKVLLLTLHSQNNNFGSVLQGLALFKSIESKDIDVRILDYRPYYSNGAIDTRAAIRNALVNFIFLPNYLIRTYRFNKINHLEKLTKRFNQFDDLKSVNDKFDLFLIGSDQVWNDSYLCGQDPAYYLDFVSRGKKASYAASLGRVADNKAIDRLCKRLKTFDSISVRENKSAIQLKNRGINAHYVLDPVFLQTVDFYRSIQAPFKKSGYILAYIIEKDDFIANVIDYIAKKTNKSIIQVGGFAKKCKCDIFPRSAGPREFLGLIDNADFVITSSFHGTAFSHIYQKQFAVVMPLSNTLRLENVLETAGTENRIVNSIDDIDRIITQRIDYNSVSNRIDEKINASILYLDNLLSDMDT